jgi:hypothetical protein
MHPSIIKFLSEHGKSNEARKVGTYTLRFGKHKGRTYDWVYENDHAYVAWIVSNKEDTYTKRIKSYFMDRIQQDAVSIENT